MTAKTDKDDNDKCVKGVSERKFFFKNMNNRILKDSKKTPLLNKMCCR